MRLMLFVLVLLATGWLLDDRILRLQLKQEQARVHRLEEQLKGCGGQTVVFERKAKRLKFDFTSPCDTASIILYYRSLSKKEQKKWH